jgi:hypothetical protein
MTRYNVSFLCAECGRFHQTKTSVSVTGGPDRVKRIDAVDRPNALPSEVPKLLRRYVMLPRDANLIEAKREGTVSDSAGVSAVKALAIQGRYERHRKLQLMILERSMLLTSC